MDTASCQLDSQNAPQSDTSTCQNKGCIIGVTIANALAQAGQFRTCMQSRGWEQVKVASLPHGDAQQAGIEDEAKQAFAEDETEHAFRMGDKAYDKKDYSTAMNYYLIAARKGHSAAQNNIGVMYEKGLGVPRNYARALKWYRKSLASSAPDDKEVTQKHIKALLKKISAETAEKDKAPKTESVAQSR